MCGRRVVFNKRRSDYVLTEQITVMIEKSCDVKIHVLPDKFTISTLVAIEFFRPKIGIGVKSCEERQPIDNHTRETG